LIGTTVGFVIVSSDDTFYQVKQSIDLFGNVYKDVIENYVDPVTPSQFMRRGIDAMLSSLDPYTVYMDKQNSGEIDLLTTGKYGGIGVTIGTSNGKVIITAVFDGYSAQRQGLRIGDQILMVDSSDISKMKFDNVSDMVRGEPGSQVKLRIKREGDEKPFDVVLVRSDVRLKAVSYYGVVDSNIGFIKLDQFSRGSDEEVKDALTNMMARTNLKGLILDLRNNPGGLLESAVNVTELFVPKGSLIVMTKGRDESSDKKYVSNQDPIAPSVPMAVLVNGNSASASEIVSGAMQDLDRAIIVGTNTFGKGLVQTILPLGYDAQLKITTARYFTPSGRCIQRIDYEKRRDGEESVTPDSLRKKFRTLDGRPVYESGGIAPDTAVAAEEHSEFVQQLMRGGYFFNFATDFRSKNDSIAQNFTANNAILSQFKNFILKNNFIYSSSLDQMIDDASRVASNSGYNDSICRELNSLTHKVKQDEVDLFDRNSTDILNLLTAEIVGRFRGDSGQIQASLRTDSVVKVAESILGNTSIRTEILLPSN
jgi:carboxyl-terminal processing protease